MRLSVGPFCAKEAGDADWLDAVEASSGGERRALGDLGEVLVEKHAGDELLAGSDADLVVEALGVVLDGVRREDQRLGDLDAREPACEERGDFTLAGGSAERLEADGCRAGRAGTLAPDRDAAVGHRTWRGTAR